MFFVVVDNLFLRRNCCIVLKGSSLANFGREQVLQCHMIFLVLSISGKARNAGAGRLFERFSKSVMDASKVHESSDCTGISASSRASSYYHVP